jgi:hypothetical protein
LSVAFRTLSLVCKLRHWRPRLFERKLSTGDLLNFLEDQIASLQLVVEAQDVVAPFVAHCAPHFVLGFISSVAQCFLLSRQHLALICPSPSEQDGGQMVIYGGSVAPPAWSKATLGCNGPDLLFLRHLTALAPLVAAPSGLSPCIVHPKTEVCISYSGLVAICYSTGAGKDRAASCSSSRRMEVV